MRSVSFRPAFLEDGDKNRPGQLDPAGYEEDGGAYSWLQSQAKAHTEDGRSAFGKLARRTLAFTYAVVWRPRACGDTLRVNRSAAAAPHAVPGAGRTQTVLAFGAAADPDEYVSSLEALGREPHAKSLNGSHAHAMGLRDGRLHFFSSYSEGAARFDTGFACDAAHFGLSIVVGDGRDLLWVQNGRARARSPGFFAA